MKRIKNESLRLPAADMGFKIDNTVPKIQQFVFGRISGVGEKKMLEDFGNLPQAVQSLCAITAGPAPAAAGAQKAGKTNISL